MCATRHASTTSSRRRGSSSILVGAREAENDQAGMHGEEDAGAEAITTSFSSPGTASTTQPRAEAAARAAAPRGPRSQHTSTSRGSSPRGDEAGATTTSDASRERATTGAALAAALLRRHRLHASLPYLAVSSGVEVPGCDVGGAYQLQEQPSALRLSGGDADTSSGAPAAAAGYLGRLRSGASNVRISAFHSLQLSRHHARGAAAGAASSSSPSSITTTTAAASAAPTVLYRDAAYTRAQAYEPFERLLRRYLDRGHVAQAAQRLLHHPDAPAPAVLLDVLLRHRVPTATLTCQVLLATLHTARRDRSTSAAAALALERVAKRLRRDAAARVLYQTPAVRSLLLEALLQEALYDAAVEVAQDMPAAWITPHTWSLLVRLAGQSKLPHSQLLWRLLGLREGASASAMTASAMSAPVATSPSSPAAILTRAGESALLGALRQRPSVAAASVTSTGAAASALSIAAREAVQVPDGWLDAHACGTVSAPSHIDLGRPVFAPAAPARRDVGATAAAPAALAPAASMDVYRKGSGDRDVGVGDIASGDTAATAMGPSGAGDAGGASRTPTPQWCALQPAELGYAVEHFDSDAATSAGDFRAAAAAGVLYSHASFQAVLDEVTREGASGAGGSALEVRQRQRALWETTALRLMNVRHGVAFGLDATTTARLLLRGGVFFGAQASPLLGVHVLQRYLRSCHLLRDQVVASQRLVEAQLHALEAADEGGVNAASKDGTSTGSAGTTNAATTSAVAKQLPWMSAAKLADLYPRLARAVAPHPAPFLVFFKLIREARDALSHTGASSSGGGGTVLSPSGGDVDGSGLAEEGRASRGHAALPMMHWELAWHTFQQLNRENLAWPSQLDVQGAGDLCLDVLEVLCHGADPWLTLNVARRVSALHVVDGVDMTLWLLHRLDPSHHTEEAREVARRLFRWLLVDVGVHVQPALHRHLVPAARALIRLGLQEELGTLYSAVLDNVYLFSAEHRDSFLHVLRDLVCPACASVLPDGDVYVDRACPNCMAVVPAKDAAALPSFRLSAEHVERVRERRKQRRQRSRERLNASVRRLQHPSTERDNAVVAVARPPRDAADVLRHHLQKKDDAYDEGGPRTADGAVRDDAQQLLLDLSTAPTLLPGVPVSSEYALFPAAAAVAAAGGGSGAGAGAIAGSAPQVLDVRAAMEESSRRLELQRAARRYVLAQRGVLDEAGGPAARAVTAGRGTPGDRALSTSAALSSALPLSAHALDASTLKYLSTSTAGGASPASADGAWVCVWCQERNTEWSSRVQCRACGAETGPAAPWRRFAYAADTGDVMAELRGRMFNCEARPVDAVVAGYLLMVYRRTFQLRATPADQDRLLRLVEMLCQLQERVLAGYVYTRLVPLAQRRLAAPPLSSLAQVFGQDTAAAYHALTAADLTRPDADGVFFDGVFGPQTCRVCFGQHDWHLCPIITRNFAGSGAATAAADGASATAGIDGGSARPAISLSPEEKQRAVLARLAQRIQLAVDSVTSLAEAAASPPGKTSPDAAAAASSASASARQGTTSPPPLLPPGKPSALLVVEAYTAFVASPFREVFAELHAADTNRLSLLLSRVKQYRRAAFVLCHIPLAQRATESYLRLIHYFNVTEAEASALLEPRTAAATWSATAAAAAAATPLVNFVQVTQTCCMCLDARHASHECPRLGDWLTGVQRLATAGAASAKSARSSSGYALADLDGDAQLRRRLKAQVDGWTTAGPERLQAFHRYLVHHVDVLRPTNGAAAVGRRTDLDDPLVYAVNRTIVKLARVGRESEMYWLYAHAPVTCVAASTTEAVLRMSGFSEDAALLLLTHAADEVRATGESHPAAAAATALLPAPVAARTAAVPVRLRCLLCFSAAHTFLECPQLQAEATEAARLLRVLRDVGGIACVPDGIGAAAAYVYGEYNAGRLSAELMRSQPELVRELLTLVRRCFATRQLSHGMRVLRRIPIDMVPPDAAYTDLWRAAGLSEEAVVTRQTELLALLDAEGLRPSVDAPPPRATHRNAFLAQFSRLLHDDLCRHCYEHGHTIATCPLFHAEVSFGRDYVAAYRMSMMSEQLDRAWQEAYLLKLVDFFATHTLFMPYHIAGVANALNAITAMWCFRGEPGIALRHLLRIPPAYRRRQAFKHVLHCLRVPPADITRLLGDFLFVHDGVGSNGSGGTSAAAGAASTGQQQQQQELVMAQHLLLPRSAIRDVARKQIFDHVPAAVAALEDSEVRMADIRARHERRAGAGAGGSMTAELKRSLQEPPAGSGAAAASFEAAVLRRHMQSGDIAQLREDFDPILAELEDAVGMKLGSRHTLFTGAIDILSAAAAAAASSASAAAAASPVDSGNAETRRSSGAASGARTAVGTTSTRVSSSGSPTTATPEAELVSTDVRPKAATAPSASRSSRRATSSSAPSEAASNTAAAAASVAPAVVTTHTPSHGEARRETHRRFPKPPTEEDEGGDGVSTRIERRGSRRDDRGPRSSGGGGGGGTQRDRGGPRTGRWTQPSSSFGGGRDRTSGQRGNANRGGSNTNSSTRHHPRRSS